jgi:hypothetical protein
MSKRSKDNQQEDDTLRMEDIVPPFRKAAGKAKGASKDQPASASDQAGNIPRLDLAEKMMATQRKRTAARRSGPNARRRPIAAAQSAGSAIPAEIPLLSEHQRIITEIVARDIQRLCDEAS